MIGRLRRLLARRRRVALPCSRWRLVLDEADGYVCEVFDRDLREFVPLDAAAATVEWGADDSPSRLLVDGDELPERFRVWEVVSAGTDRSLLLEAISGLPALYARTLT